MSNKQTPGTRCCAEEHTPFSTDIQPASHHPIALLIDIYGILRVLREYEEEVGEELDFDAYIARAMDTASYHRSYELLLDEWTDDVLNGGDNTMLEEVGRLITVIARIVNIFVDLFTQLHLYQDNKVHYRVGKRMGSCLALVRSDYFYKSEKERLRNGSPPEEDPYRLL